MKSACCSAFRNHPLNLYTRPELQEAGSDSSGADSGWLDRLLLVTPADRYAVQSTVTSTPAVLTARPDSIRFQVTVTARSPTLPNPSDWVLIASGIDNIATADTTCALVFTDNSAQVEVITNPENLNRIDVNGDDRADQLQMIGTRETSFTMAEEVVVSKQLRVCVSMVAK